MSSPSPQAPPPSSSHSYSYTYMNPDWLPSRDRDGGGGGGGGGGEKQASCAKTAGPRVVAEAESGPAKIGVDNAGAASSSSSSSSSNDESKVVDHEGKSAIFAADNSMLGDESSGFIAPIRTIFDKSLSSVVDLNNISNSTGILMAKKAGPSMADLIKKAKSKDINTVPQRNSISCVTVSASSTTELGGLNDLEKLDIDNIKSKLEKKKELVDKLHKKKVQTKQIYSEDSVLKKKTIQSTSSKSAWEQLQEEEQDQRQKVKILHEEKRTISISDNK